ncbi:hypothetical protein JCM11641_007752 [Rhodosporidiobolus odoratus]
MCKPLLCLSLLLCLLPPAVAQLHSPSTFLPAPSPSLSSTLTVSSTPSSAPTGNSTVASAVLSFANAFPSTLPTSSPLPERPAPPARPRLDTHLTPVWGIAGSLLISSGLAVGLAGSYLRRLLHLLAGFYTLAVVVLLVILHYAGQHSSVKLQAVYLVVCIVSGSCLGALCLVFDRLALSLSGALAGFSTSIFLLSTRNDSLIRPVGLRYILISGLIVGGCALSSFPKLSRATVLVCSSLVGAFVTLVGVDCFASTGLKEFYVYSLGFSKLFPKLQGHYYITTVIEVELGLTGALFICMMVFQSRFYRMFKKKDADAQRAKQDLVGREQKVGDRQRRMSRQQLSEWEEKYGTGTMSSDERTLYAGEGMEKVRSSGSGSTILSTKSPSGARSIEFLPKLDLGEFGASPSRLTHSPPTPALPPPPKRASTMASRPVLATIQPSEPSVEWNSYVSARKVGVAVPQPSHSHRASRTISMYSSLSRPSFSPQVQLSLPDGQLADEDDDDVPLAIAARTRSSPSLRRPLTMYDVSPPLPSVSSPAIPRSHSRAASLAMPAVLSAPVSPPPPSRSPSRSPVLTRTIGTLIDLTEPSKFDPYQQRNRETSRDAERVVIGDRRKTQQAKDDKRKSEGPKIMDFGELEERHKKRMSMLQTTANDHVATETAKKQYKTQQQAEADYQRRKEADSIRRRSISNLYLAGDAPRSSSSEAHRRSSASISGLSTLLKLGSGMERSSSSLEVPQLPSGQRRAPDVPRPRHHSTQSLSSRPTLPPQPHSPSRGSLSSRPKTTRRHSLGTLLEASLETNSIAADLAELAPPQRPFVADEPPLRRGRSPPPSGQERVEKVNEWRRSSPGRGSPSMVARQVVDNTGKGEFGVLPQVQQQQQLAETQGTKKKNSWLAY